MALLLTQSRTVMHHWSAIWSKPADWMMMSTQTYFHWPMTMFSKCDPMVFTIARENIHLMEKVYVKRWSSMEEKISMEDIFRIFCNACS